MPRIEFWGNETREQCDAIIRAVLTFLTYPFGYPTVDKEYVEKSRINLIRFCWANNEGNMFNEFCVEVGRSSRQDKFIIGTLQNTIETDIDNILQTVWNKKPGLIRY